MDAIILAGGLGTRLKSVVSDLPKPMAPISGRPFLAHQMDYWIPQGVSRFVLSVGYKHETIEKHFGNAYRGAKVEYSIEAQPLGTGGGLLNSLKLIPKGQPFLLLNGDTYFEISLADLQAFHAGKQSDLTLALHAVGNNTRYSGVDVAADGRIARIQARTPSEGARLINGGIYLFRDRAVLETAFPAIEKASFEDQHIPALIAAGAPVYGCVCQGKFIDIGIPEDYHAAESYLKSR